MHDRKSKHLRCEGNVIEEEWHTVGILKKAQKRRGMNDFPYHALRDISKVEGDRTKEFVDKYKEVRVQTLRGNVVNTQLSMA